MKNLSIKTKIAVIGLGYVGLPLAMSFAKKFSVTGFDISQRRINQLIAGNDYTLEVKKSHLMNTNILFTSNIEDISNNDFYIVTVPTPVNKKNQPDLSFLEFACKIVASVISKGSVIIFESTVYPGCTDEFCIPILESISGYKVNNHFFVGYSPERINPGDKKNSFEKINKVVSGSNLASLNLISRLYSSVIEANVFKAKSIKVAEASKIIENTQRDINIALMNELSEIFEKLDIDTNDVISASGTKWNFHTYFPGLVGGHCIGVDPYYLAYKAKQIGVKPNIILSGRATNNRVASRIVDLLLKFKSIHDCKSVLVLGLTFKEDCPDLRNSGAIKVVMALNKHGIKPNIFDPYHPTDPCIENLNYNFIPSLSDLTVKQDAILLLVPHKDIIKKSKGLIVRLRKNNSFLFDLRNSLNLPDSYSL